MGLKELTGKNRNDYELEARNLIDNANEILFKELVDSDSFLFDFIKQNVANRLSDAINESNFKNILGFLKYYSPSYEEFLVSTLVKYADESITDTILEKLEFGIVDEKIYAAKYFQFVQDSIALPILKEHAFSECESLQRNCAEALALFDDKEIYNNAIEKLNSDDEFEKLSGVKFLIAYGDKSTVSAIIETMKTSSLSENIAGELPYLVGLFEILENNFEDGLLVINNIINAIGEIIGLECVFHFQLFDVMEYLIHKKDSKSSVVLLNAVEKFDTLTENDEYLFDESKDVQGEVHEITKLLRKVNKKELQKNINPELSENSPFVYTALELATDLYAIRELLKSNNQTIILKTVEILKSLGNLDESTKTVAMLKVTDSNIKSIIRAL